MARRSKSKSVGIKDSSRITRNGSEIDLVAARSRLNSELNTYSRKNRSKGYAQQRRKHARRRHILVGVTAGIAAILIAGVAAAAGYYMYLNNSLHANADMDSLNAALSDKAAAGEPFWALLVGTDSADTGTPRTDTIIMARIDPTNKTAALVSIPRDTRVTIPNEGYQKINSEYTFGQNYDGKSGPSWLINAVSELTGIDNISDYAQVDFDGFKDIVDALGGVTVDVPVSISDPKAGPVDVSAGVQTLDGAHAMVFVRSRDFPDGDYQRQADQRTFLQALAKQVLSADPATIVNTITKMCQMTTTNMDVSDIASIATSLKGMQETDIHTYTIPSTTQTINGISYVIADDSGTQKLFSELNAGQFPDPSSAGGDQGVTPDAYQASSSSSSGASDATGGSTSSVNTSKYVVDVRNGYGISGSAQAVSDMLALAGYQQGEVGNANSFVYTETLIVYNTDSDQAAANDIKNRLGYGRVIASLGRYSFTGDILVVVGSDYQS